MINSSISGKELRPLFGRYPQRQKQALTQIRGAGALGEQPHIGFGAEHSVSEPHSL